MKRHIRAKGGVPLLAIVFVVLLTGVGAAQEPTVITGRVTTGDGTPIGGASVLIPQLPGVGTQADQGGAYRLLVPAARVTGQQVTLTARFIGFRPQERPITLRAGAQSMDFSLERDPFRLSEVVVTGVSEATEQTKLTVSVARLSEEQLTAVPASSPVTAIAGKVSGVRVSTGSGNPGAEPSIRLRGSTNLGIGRSRPLIIVDGAIAANNLGDIDANDIESIEILKGAAAASFYGSNAANGVVNITTKRGRNIADNSIAFTLRSEFGRSGLERYVPLNTSHYWETNPDGSFRLNPQGQRIIKAGGVADNPYPASGPNRFRNQLQEWMDEGDFFLTNMQVGGRSGATNFNTSFSTDRNAGILPFVRGQDRQNVRLNVDQGIGTVADLSLSMTYGINKNDYDPTGSLGWFSLMQMPPDVDLEYPFGLDSARFYPNLGSLSPSARENPLNRLANDQFNLRRERIIGSVSARYRPLDWLRLEGSYGTDRLNRRQQFYQFRGILGEGGQETDGSLDRRSYNNVADNSQINATMNYGFLGEVRGTTRLAALYEQARRSLLRASGQDFIVSAVPDLSGLDNSKLFVDSNEETERTVNYMASQSFDIRDRYLLDFLVRRDGSSLFGPDARWASFYRVSGAYRISQDFELPGIQELKIRAARGTAGLRPNFLDQYEYLNLSGGNFSTRTQLGNRELRPAIQTEDEFGVNVTFLDRFDLEVVHANRLTRGAFLNVPVSPAVSRGFASQVQNAADVQAWTTEGSFQISVLNRMDFGYSLNLTADRTRQKIVRMDRAPFRVNAGGQGQDVFYYAEGEPLGIIFGTKFARSYADIAHHPTLSSRPASDFVVNHAGYLVLASQRGTAAEQPIIAHTAEGAVQRPIGDVNPDLNFGIANNVRWRGFGVYALLDGQVGGDVYNFTKQWMFQDLRHGDLDQRNVPEGDRIAQTFFSGGLYNALNASSHFVEDATFVKLRELSVSYTVSPDVLGFVGLGRMARGAKLALIGRNLKTWTSYSGFDPDVTSGGDFNFRIDGFRYPNFRTISGQVEITF